MLRWIIHTIARFNQALHSNRNRYSSRYRPFCKM